MAEQTWYVGPAGTAVVWETAVTDDEAQVDIYRVVQREDIPWPQVYLWRRSGRAVTAAEVTAAEAATSADPIPDPYTPPTPDPGLEDRLDDLEDRTRVLVLDAADPVPGGTPAGTVIVRREE